MKLNVPLFVMLPRKTIADKKMIINLNNYRNWHYIVNNQVKEAYAEQLEPFLCRFRAYDPVNLTFVLFKGSLRKSDRANVLSIHEKFFCDALIHYGCIADDSDEYIKWTKYESGHVDKNNPRVEVYVE